MLLSDVVFVCLMMFETDLGDANVICDPLRGYHCCEFIYIIYLCLNHTLQKVFHYLIWRSRLFPCGVLDFLCNKQIFLRARLSYRLIFSGAWKMPKA